MPFTEELKITERQDLTAPEKNSNKFNFLAEVTALEQAEAIIAGIEESQTETEPRNFPTANLQMKISDLREALMQSPAVPERVRQAEVRLRQELGLWRMTLAKRDDNFSAFDLRSFCENTEPPIDSEFFAALAKFYRNMPPTAPVLSKFDYVITQYFSRHHDRKRRALRFEADKIVLELRRLNHEWTDGASSASPFSQPQIRESIAALAQLSANAKAHKTLKSWLDNEFFNYTRAVKRRLIETFFIPEVTAAVVVCNLVVGNHFAALCEADSGKLSETAAMFAADEFAHQSTTNQLNQAFQSLLHLSLEESSAETAAQERLATLVSLSYQDNAEFNALIVEQSVEGNTRNQIAPPVVEQAVSEVVDNLAPQITASDIEGNEKTVEFSDKVLEAEFITETPQSVEAEERKKSAAVNSISELEIILDSLTNHKPNLQLIKDYLQKSSVHEVRTLNLSVFLPEHGDVIGRTDDKTLRRALGIIIRAQDLTQFIEKGEGEVIADLLEEVNLMRDEIQEVNQLLRASMRGVAGAREERERESFENLLYATNTLVEAQLRLNTAVVRRQPKNEKVSAVDQISALKYEKVKIDAPVLTVQTTTSKQRRVNPLLLVFATFVVIVAGGLLFLDFSSIQKPASADGFRKIELSQLKSADVFVGAKVNKETLYAFPSKEWDTLNSEQKKEKLRSLMMQSEQLGFKKIVVIDKDGQVVANAWAGEVNIS